MKELDKPVIEQLMYVYEKFLDEGLSEDVSREARELYNELSPAYTLLDKVVNFSWKII